MKRLFVFLFLTFVIFMPNSNALEVIYTDLGNLGGPATNRAWAINDTSQITGASHIGPYDHPGFYWDNGTMISLGYLSGTKHSIGLDINSASIVVGEASLGPQDGNWNGHLHPFRWENGLMVNLGTFAGTENGKATGINDNGTIVGYTSWGILGGRVCSKKNTGYKNGSRKL